MVAMLANQVACSVLALGFVVSPITVDPGGRAQAGNPEEAAAEIALTADAVRELEQVFDGIVTVFEEEHIGSIRVAADADWRELSVPDREPVMKRAFVWISSGCTRALLMFGETDAALERATPDTADRAMIWTGSEWHATEKRGDDHRLHAFSAMPNRQPRVEYLPAFNPCDNWMWFLGPHALSKYITPRLLLRYERSGDEDEFVFSTSETSRTATVDLTVLVKPERRLRSVGLTFGVREASHEGAAVEPFGRKLLRIETWEEFEGRAVPASATYLHARLEDSDGDGELRVMATHVRRRSIRRLRSDDDARRYIEMPELDEGDSVLDTCYGLRYKIGGRVLFVDHLRIELDRPIRGRITNELPEFVGLIERDPSGRYRPVNHGER